LNKFKSSSTTTTLFAFDCIVKKPTSHNKQKMPKMKMPSDNRVHSGLALQTHDIWSKTIGHDPHAPTQKERAPGYAGAGPTIDYQAMLALARLTSGSDTGPDTRGSCKKCGGMGHLTFQCRNHIMGIGKDVEPATKLPEEEISDNDSISSISSSSSSSDEKHKKKEKIQTQEKEQREKRKEG